MWKILSLLILFLSQCTPQKFNYIGGPIFADQIGNYTTLSSTEPSWPGGRNSVRDMTILSNGSILIFGGYGFDHNDTETAGQLNDLWRYDTDHSFHFIGGSDVKNQKGIYSNPSWPGGRYDHMMVTLLNGSVLLFGGNGFNDDVSGFLNDIWIYDPTSLKFNFVGGKSENQLGNYTDPYWPGGRNKHMMITIKDGSVLLFGGYGFSGSNVGYLNDLWKYEPTESKFYFIGGSNVSNQFSNPSCPGGRYNHMMVALLNGSILMFGGYGYGFSDLGYLNDLWRYEPTESKFYFLEGNRVNQVGKYSDPVWPGGRNGHTMITLKNGSVLLFGGVGYGTINSGSLNDLWIYEPTQLAFHFLGGPMIRNQLGNYSISNSWPGARNSHLMLLLSNGSFLIYGGLGYDSTDFGQLSDMWRYDFPASSASITSSVSQQSSNPQQSTNQLSSNKIETTIITTTSKANDSQAIGLFVCLLLIALLSN